MPLFFPFFFCFLPQSTLKVTGITKTTNRHEQIVSEILSSTQSINPKQIQLQTSEEAYRNANLSESNPNPNKFKNVVFCAPPSGFDDYPRAVKEAIEQLWEGPSGGGSFVFTSSGGV